MTLLADGSWQIVRRLRYCRDSRIIDRVPQFGFHSRGRRFAVEYAEDWVAELGAEGVLWTAGPRDPGLAASHLSVPLRRPRFVAVEATSTVLVTDAGGVHRVAPGLERVDLLAAAGELGVDEPGNCDVATDGTLWLNDILGHQVLQLALDGRVMRRFGDGVAGFQLGTVTAEHARFGAIYDLRCGSNGRVYVLDSTNFAVRVIDPLAGTVTTICGDGEPGDRGDGGPADSARLGGSKTAGFDGPWSLVVDAEGNVHIGDTHNHAVRRIDGRTRQITTIAAPDSASPPAEGVTTRDRSAVLFTKICGLDLDADGRLLVPDWVSDEVDELLILEPVSPRLIIADAGTPHPPG